MDVLEYEAVRTEGDIPAQPAGETGASSGPFFDDNGNVCYYVHDISSVLRLPD
jgi:hypothetical protein